MYIRWEELVDNATHANYHNNYSSLSCFVDIESLCFPKQLMEIGISNKKRIICFGTLT
jgi:hypothetical protein